MKAAIVHAFDQPPKFGEIDAPTAQEGEVLVTVQAAALSQLVRAQASGKHYTSGKTLPFVPGADGVGRLADGSRVYFAFPRAPIGAMAQTVAVKAINCTPIPANVSDLTAAAIANPGMSSWAALEDRARFQAGESVLVNGAAGTSGRLAIQIAKYLGASRVIATARNPAVEDELRELGADTFIALNQTPEKLVERFHHEINTGGVDVVLDYLWGQPAECFLDAAIGHGSSEAGPRIRFVNIGSLAGATINLTPAPLRSSGLEMLGSGLGSVSHEGLVKIVGKVLQAIGPAQLKIDAHPIELSEVEQAWGHETAQRIVLTF
jgi:NADPH:quinone reductase-like Zn-dependent oxidoreductase